MENNCCICTEKPATFAIDPCHHLVYCENCHKESNNHNIKKCPFCRGKINKFIEITNKYLLENLKEEIITLLINDSNVINKIAVCLYSKLDKNIANSIKQDKDKILNNVSNLLLGEITKIEIDQSINRIIESNFNNHIESKMNETINRMTERYFNNYTKTHKEQINEMIFDNLVNSDGVIIRNRNNYNRSILGLHRVRPSLNNFLDDYD
jgi:hypothetical protein